jgi:hypothetical protein
MNLLLLHGNDRRSRVEVIIMVSPALSDNAGKARSVFCGEFFLEVLVRVCVYYCSTYYKAVRVRGGG